MTIFQERTIQYKGKEYKQYPGSPFDRGSADSYYHRNFNPHCITPGEFKRVALEPNTPEYEAYSAGYEYNELFGEKKDWGNYDE